MSALIKSGRVVVRPLGAAAVKPPLSPLEEERNRLVQRVAALEGELRQRDETIAKVNEELPQALEKAAADAHAAGLAAAETREKERTLLLQAGLRQAQAELKESLSSLDRLAALLARECLDVILGDARHRASSVRKIITSQLSKIEKASLLSAELSKSDFPDEQTLAALADELRLKPGALVAGEAVPPGGCRMVLRLGAVEVGLDRQWTSLKAVLGAIAEGT